MSEKLYTQAPLTMATTMAVKPIRYSFPDRRWSFFWWQNSCSNLRVLSEGHRLFLSTEVVSEVSARESQQLCVSWEVFTTALVLVALSSTTTCCKAWL